MITEKRAFGTRERVALILNSGGRCSVCDVELSKGWHADHVVPWSKGGLTDVTNGQALCPDCNRRKGNQMIEAWPEHVKLRRWQQRALAALKGHKQKDFLAVATPGAGKTTFLLKALHDGLRSGRFDRAMIVVPSQHLKLQGADAAEKIGIHLNYKFKNQTGVLAKDVHGAIVTYAQVAAEPRLFQSLCTDRTFVGLDEIHHGSENKSWGTSAKIAFDRAAVRLLLSGTPFRSDKEAIPFITYVNGKSYADFSYGYGEALMDGVCRPVIFPTFEGEMGWYRRGEKRIARFSDDLPELELSDRLNAALMPRGQFIQVTIAAAVRKLKTLREEHPDAGGLIIAKDIFHAKAYADILEKLTGEYPVVVSCEEENASDKIKEFKNGRMQWIVAVKMVSEGVDLPRLRVAVYATNIITEMFFRQAVGRLVRVQEGREEDHAFFYFPADDRLKQFAADIMMERQHQLDEQIKELMKRSEEEEDAGQREDKVLSLFTPLSSTGEASDVILNSEVINRNEIEEAERYIEELGMPKSYDPAILARLLQRARGDRPKTHTPRPAYQEKNKTDRKVELRKVLNRLVNVFVNQSEGHYTHEDVYLRLINIDKVKQDAATEEQLRNRIRMVEGWMEAARDAS